MHQQRLPDDLGDAFTGYPPGRPAQSSLCWMLDLAKAGRSSRRYPIAPDGHIPNSVIREYFEPYKASSIDDAGASSKAKKSIRWRQRHQIRAVEAEATIASLDDASYLDATARWESWADEGAGNEARVSSGMLSSGQSDSETTTGDYDRSKSLEHDREEAETKSASESAIQEQQQQQEEQQLPSESAEFPNQASKRPRRAINAGGPKQPPLPALPSQQQLRLLRQRREMEQRQQQLQQQQQQQQAEQEATPAVEPEPERTAQDDVKADEPLQQPVRPPPQQPPRPSAPTKQPRPAAQKLNAPLPKKRQQPAKPIASRRLAAPPSMAPPTPPPPPVVAPSQQPQDDASSADAASSEPEIAQVPAVIVIVEDVDSDDKQEELITDEPRFIDELPEGATVDTAESQQGVQDAPSYSALTPVAEEVEPEAGASEMHAIEGEVGQEFDAGRDVAADAKVEPEAELAPEIVPEVESEPEQEPEMDQTEVEPEVPSEVETDSETEPDALSEAGSEMSNSSGLLKEIVCEPWFRVLDVPLNTEPVARALTELMSERGTSAQEHREMCRRILDIKQQLSLDEDFEFRLVSDIVAQLECLMDDLMKLANQSKTLAEPSSSSVDSDNGEGYRVGAVRSKGASLVDLLRDMGHSLAPELSKRWTSALLAASLAEDRHRTRLDNRRRRRRRRGRGELSDSGKGSESPESDQSVSSDDSRGQRRLLKRRKLVALSEEERQTFVTSLSQPDSNVDVAEEPAEEDSEDAAVRAGIERLLLLDETLKKADVESGSAAAAAETTLVLPPIVQIGSEVGLEGAEEPTQTPRLPPIFSPSENQTNRSKTKQSDGSKEETVFDRMGDFRLKRLVFGLPPIGQIDLDSIAERSRQSAYRCPRVASGSGRHSWSDQEPGFLTDRLGGVGRPDVSNYLATWRSPSTALSDDTPAAEAPAALSRLHQRDPLVSHLEPIYESPTSRGQVRASKDHRLVPIQPSNIGSLTRPSDQWDGHCRMECLAKRGLAARGVPIERHLARDRLLMQTLLLRPLD